MIVNYTVPDKMLMIQIETFGLWNGPYKKIRMFFPVIWHILNCHLIYLLFFASRDIAAGAEVTKKVELTPKYKGKVGVYVALSTDRAEFDNFAYTKAV